MTTPSITAEQAREISLLFSLAADSMSDYAGNRTMYPSELEGALQCARQAMTALGSRALDGDRVKAIQAAKDGGRKSLMEPIHTCSWQDALRTAIFHIEHMAAWIGEQGTGYNFESLGEDILAIRAALTAPAPEERRQGHSKLVYDKATRSIVTVDTNPPTAPAQPVGNRMPTVADMPTVYDRVPNITTNSTTAAAPPPSPWRAVAYGLVEAVRELKASLFSEKVNYGKLSPETFAAIYEIKIADGALAAYAAAKEANNVG